MFMGIVKSNDLNKNYDIYQQLLDMVDLEFIANRHNISILFVIEILTTPPIKYNNLSEKFCVPCSIFLEVVQDFVNLADLMI
jgi:hypothetical protein